LPNSSIDILIALNFRVFSSSTLDIRWYFW
jgi:hypothetical protein